MICYQCEKETKWLAPDGRCGGCTRYTPEEIQGEEDLDYNHDPSMDDLSDESINAILHDG